MRDWDDVRVFLALYRARTLAGAGERLGVDASTASRRLVTLEETLGARLFDRTREGLVPTAAAEQVHDAAEEIEQGIFRFAQNADALERAAEGVVRITAAPGVADAFVAPTLGRLYAKHPLLRVELLATIGVVDLTRREADLAIRTIKPTSGDLVRTKIFESHPAVLASPAYAKELGTLREAKDARWITWGRDLAHLPVQRFLDAHVADPILRTSHIGAQLAAAEAGLGVTVQGLETARTRNLVPVKLGAALADAVAALPGDEVWLVCHRAMREVPRVAAVWQFVLEEVARFSASLTHARTSSTASRSTGKRGNGE